MRRRQTAFVLELDVVGLGSADDRLLRFGRERLPGVEVGDVALHGDVAAAGVRGILVADDGEGEALIAARVLGAVDEADQVAAVEVGEAVRLVDDRDGVAEAGEDQAGELVAEVLALGADVQQHVAGRRRRQAPAVGERAERMQLRRSAVPGQQARPGVGADRHDAAERRRLVAMADCAHQVRHPGERHPHLLLGVGAQLEDQEAGATSRAGLYRALRLSQR